MSCFMPGDLNVLCADITEHHGLIIFIPFSSPVNPGLQEQLNDPLVFVQFALSLLQLWVPVAHSSMSAMRSTDCTQSRKSKEASIYNAKTAVKTT